MWKDLVFDEFNVPPPFFFLFLFKDITLFSLRREMKPAFNKERETEFFSTSTETRTGGSRVVAPRPLCLKYRHFKMMVVSYHVLFISEWKTYHDLTFFFFCRDVLNWPYIFLS